MSEQEPPVVITDKRARKRKEEAEVLAEQLGPETVDDAMARVDRLEELMKKGALASSGGPELTLEEKAELLGLQVREDIERDKAEQAQGDLIPAMTAFLVIVGHDGSARATSDVNTNLLIDREATVDDMFSGASIVLRDINAAINSKHVVFGLSVSAQAMQEKQQRNAMVSSLHPSSRKR